MSEQEPKRNREIGEYDRKAPYSFKMLVERPIEKLLEEGKDPRDYYWFIFENPYGTYLAPYFFVKNAIKMMEGYMDEKGAIPYAAEQPENPGGHPLQEEARKATIIENEK